MENCEIIESKLIEFFDKTLSKKDTIIVEKHIESCGKCKQSLKELRLVLGMMDNDKELIPSKQVNVKFDEFLTDEKLKQELETNQESKNYWRFYLQVAATIALVITAFVIGRFQSSSNKLAVVDDKKVSEVIAMLQSQSASRRILAIDLSLQLKNNDTKIIDALISRLYNDKNSNVRLEAAEALTHFAAQENVRDAFIKALETDSEPMVQIEIIRILTKIQEKRALEPMKKLLDQKQTEKYVKIELQSTIAKLM